jgi:hypothetical protein
MKRSSVPGAAATRHFLINLILALAAIGAGACNDPVKPTATATPTPTSPPSCAAVSVTSVQPRVGFTAGGIPITLRGSGFRSRGHSHARWRACDDRSCRQQSD